MTEERPFPCFDELGETSRAAITAHAKKARMPKGAELFMQGDTCEQILYLTEGQVRVYRLHESGQEITLYYLEKGEQCNVNLNSAFTKSPAVGTAMCETPIEGYLLPAAVVREVYLHETVYQQFVFSLFARRMECMAGLIESVRFKKLDTRLLEWLQEQSGDRIAVTHEKLAAHLGTSREVVSRLLKGFEHRGLVRLHRGIIERRGNLL